MKSLYIRCARFGSNRDEWISTHTDGFLSRKSSGNSVYGIRWNHISFIALSPASSTDQYPLHPASKSTAGQRHECDRKHAPFRNRAVGLLAQQHQLLIVVCGTNWRNQTSTHAQLLDQRRRYPT